ncbi:MAG: carboxypeptidase-like regulatory domain-containing protein [Planctomycetota bacterium]
MRAFLAVVVLLAVFALAWFAVEARRAPASETGVAATGREHAARGAELERAAKSDAARAPADESNAPEEGDASDVPESTLTGGISPEGGIVLEVVDAKGAPRAGVKLGVELELWRRLGPEHPDKDQHQEVVTDAHGRAPIAASHPSEIGFIALHRAHGYDPIASQPFDLAPGTTDVVRLVYPTRVMLRGTVRDFAGRVPTRATRVDLETAVIAPGADGAQHFRVGDPTMQPDETGRYEFEITPGWFTLGASLAGETAFETLTLHVIEEPSELEVDLRVPTTDRRVDVRLVSNDPIDPLLAFVHVSARSELEGRELPPCVVARRLDELRFSAPHVGDGRWRLELVPGVEYELYAGAPGFDTAKLRLPRDVTEFEVRLEREAAAKTRTLRGRVRGPHGPLANGVVLLLRTSDLVEIGRGDPRADGTFEIAVPDVPGMRTTALLHGIFGVDGFAVLGPIAIDRSRDDLELVVGAPLTIAGRVEGLKDPAGAHLSLRATAADLARPEHDALGAGLTTRALYHYAADLAPDGLFAVDGLAAGEYELFVEPRSGAQPPARLRVRAGTEDVRVVLGDGLERDVVFDCTVVDALTRRPIEGAEVEALGATPHSSVSRRTDASGRCELRGLLAGRWFLATRALDHANAVERYVDYAPGRHAVEIALSPSCALDVELVDARGAPLAGVELAVTTRDGMLIDQLDHFGNWDGYVVDSNVAGRARLSGLPTGPLRVVVGWSRDGARDIELANTLLDGATRESELENVRELTTFDVDLVPGAPLFVRRTLP